MTKSKKFFSVFLSVAILISSIFVGGVVSANTGLNLYTTTNTYDDAGVSFINTSISGNPGTYVNSETKDNNFAVYNTQIEHFDDTHGNAAHFTKAEPQNGDWRALVRIYKQGETNLTQFKPKAATTYELKLKYNVTSKPSSAITLQIVQASWQEISYQKSDLNTADRILADVFTVSEATDGWVDATIKFTAPASPKYICLGTAGNWVSGVNVWVDDIVVSECGTVNIHNYNGTDTQTADVTANTTVAELSVPEIEGMLFDGAYADAEFYQPIDSTDKAADYTNIYYKWKVIGYGEYYVGFENYIDLKNVISLADDASIVTSGAFAGGSALKLDLSGYKFSAFELRDENSIDAIANHKYKIAFKYKATETIKVSAGMGLSFNLPATAYSLTDKLNLSDCADWSEATLEFVADHSLTDGYSLALLVSAENGGQVYFDDIYITDITDKTAGAGLSFELSEDWYPTINTVDIWGGQSDLSEPKDTDNDGIYEITNGAELAYIIKNGGTIGEAIGCSFIITKDIYLNDITAINWKTGEVLAEGYTPNTWFNQGANSFQGSIDGDGHTVYGMYRNDSPPSTQSYSGWGTALVPKIEKNATIAFKDLAVDYAFINVECAASAFVATTNGAGGNAINISFDGCYVGAKVQLRGGDAGAFVGYSGGDGGNVTIKNCYSLATTVGTVDYGLVAYVRQATLTVSNSFNANGPITSYDNSNWTGKYTFTNSYQTEEAGFHNYFYKTNFETVSADNMTGLDVFSDTSKMLNLNTDDVFVAEEGFPRLKIFVKSESAPQHWQGDTTVPSDTDGDGIIEIGKASELAYIIKVSGGEGKSYILTSDIYLNDITKINWSTGAVAQGYNLNKWYGSYNFTTFSGNIDGNGHTIYGLYNNQNMPYTAAATGSALIPAVTAGEGVTIKNLGIDNAFINYESNASAFVGYLPANSSLIFDKCFVGDKVTLEGGFAGAFNGRANNNTTITITNSYSLAKMTTHPVEGSTAYKAGFCGHHSGCSTNVTVKNSFNGEGPIFSGYYTTPKSAENCYQTADNPPTGVTKLSVDNMKGNNVLTDGTKMSMLGVAFKTTNRNFADNEYYTYLPEGTVIGGNYNPSFYEHFINSALAPIDSEEVIFGSTMTRGAYVKFGTKPDAEDILIPTSKLAQVVQGTAEQVLLNREYYDIEFDVISENLASQTSSAVNYIFITDIHYPGDYASQKSALIRQMQLICKMANENENIDFIAVGGDIVEGYDDNKEKCFARIQEILEPLTLCTKPVFVAAGNHDDNCYGTFTSPEKVASNLDWDRNVIDYVVNPTTKNGIKQDKDYNNEKYDSKYYYYDLVGKKTRIIVLDSSNYPQKYDDDGNVTLYLNEGYTADSAESRNKYINGYNYYGYSKAQLQWLANEALTAEDGWNYMFISHMGIDEATNSAVVNYGTDLRAIIKAFQTKTAYVNDTLEVNKDWSNTSGKILSYHYGHVHSEQSVYSEDIELWQFSSATAQSKNELISTPDELCFDVISVTQANIAKQNLGSGEDNRFVVAADVTIGDANNDFITDIFDLVSVSNVVNGKSSRLSFSAADLNKDCILNTIDLEEIRKIIIGK